jgi:hypothetical protein
MPGEPVEVKSGGVSIEPFTTVERLESGDLTHAEWLATCDAAGIRSLSLAPS